MTKLLIKNATMVNEGRQTQGDMLVEHGRISHISSNISAPNGAEVIDAAGKLLIPGMIDDQVHFREPGFPLKGTIASESRAAVAGGVTSYMEMPNVNPQTTNLQALEDKYSRAALSSVANFSFYLGATNDNLYEIRRLAPEQACGVKIFMGASTGNMLVDNADTLAAIFAESPVLIATHCEDTPTIKLLEDEYRARYGDDVPAREHGRIRSTEACLKSSTLAVELAKKYGTRLHVLHITTKEELALFEAAPTLEALRNKQITAEACVHHLFFNEQDYDRLGHLLKCNPAVKAREDQLALQDAVRRGVIDIIATDHAPHTWDEKQNTYFNAPSGLPLVQHPLLALFDLHKQGALSLEMLVQKTSHAVAERFQLQDRGYLREGYWADLVLVDQNTHFSVNKENLFYQCGWSPFEGHTFPARIDTTFVNGEIVFHNAAHTNARPGQRLGFNRR
ncbi:MAG: dihydroorotase [Plesiomonas sp.]|uniref:dihydroorotase n=1 Tax=Plesiomonas sp. TaxID=2486279 RepID=UPI003F3FB2CB